MSRESTIKDVEMGTGAVPAEKPRELHIRVTELEGQVNGLGQAVTTMQDAIETILARLMALEAEVGLL